jgi:hypothetical protein
MFKVHSFFHKQCIILMKKALDLHLNYEKMDTAEMKLEMIQFITSLQNEEETFIVYSKLKEAKMKVDDERGWLDNQTQKERFNMGESILEHLESSKSVTFEKPVRLIEEWLK